MMSSAMSRGSQPVASGSGSTERIMSSSARVEATIEVAEVFALLPCSARA